jgi:hypothetical protein
MFGKDGESPPVGNAFETHGLVDKKVTAAFLGVSEKTVEKLQREGLPYYKLSPRRNGYFIPEIKEWLVQTRRA